MGRDAAIRPRTKPKARWREGDEEMDRCVRTTNTPPHPPLAAPSCPGDSLDVAEERHGNPTPEDSARSSGDDIYRPCSFQDSTPAYRKVGGSCRFWRRRIEATMITIWGAPEASRFAAEPVGPCERIDDGGAEGHLDRPHSTRMMPGGAQRQTQRRETAMTVRGPDATGPRQGGPPAAASELRPDTRDADVETPTHMKLSRRTLGFEAAGASRGRNQEA